MFINLRTICKFHLHFVPNFKLRRALPDNAKNKTFSIIDVISACRSVLK